jgi:hypothetical protein
VSVSPWRESAIRVETSPGSCRVHSNLHHRFFFRDTGHRAHVATIVILIQTMVVGWPSGAVNGGYLRMVLGSNGAENSLKK